MSKPLATHRIAPHSVPLLSSRTGEPLLNYDGHVRMISRFAIVEYHAVFLKGRWVWRRHANIATGRKSEMFTRHPEYRNVPRGGLQNRPVEWADVRLMVLPWAWASPDIDGMIAAVDADRGTAPVLADALQDAGFPEACPVLAILRSWGTRDAT